MTTMSKRKLSGAAIGDGVDDSLLLFGVLVFINIVVLVLGPAMVLRIESQLNFPWWSMAAYWGLYVFVQCVLIWCTVKVHRMRA